MIECSPTGILLAGGNEFCKNAAMRGSYAKFSEEGEAWDVGSDTEANRSGSVRAGAGAGARSADPEYEQNLWDPQDAPLPFPFSSFSSLTALFGSF